mgnify:CR=1 FL=1
MRHEGKALALVQSPAEGAVVGSWQGGGVQGTFQRIRLRGFRDRRLIFLPGALVSVRIIGGSIYVLYTSERLTVVAQICDLDWCQ